MWGLTGILTDVQGRDWELPVLLSWDVSHGMGDGCDSFSISFVYDPSMRELLQNAVRFRGVYDGETVFVGLVDEFAAEVDETGGTVTVNGRGLQALLLDNEAEAAVYYGVGLDFLLNTHVSPWGITEMQRNENYPRVSIFPVDAGMSQWGILERYCRFSGGSLPYFSRDGILMLGPEEGALRVIDESVAVVWQRWQERRYGVISQVLVRNRAWGSRTVDNSEFLARGGRCRRVISTPRHSSYDALRYTGEYQIAESQRDSRICEVELAALFSAFPGDRVWLDGDPLKLGLKEGLFVSGSRCYADDKGAGTILTLTY